MFKTPRKSEKYRIWIFFGEVYSTINFDVRIDAKYLEFYENVLRKEIEFLSDSGLESSITILHSINEKVGLLQSAMVDWQISIYLVKYVWHMILPFTQSLWLNKALRDEP